MKLAEFIAANRESILVEWEAYARTVGPEGKTMDIAALRDHANEMLTVIVDDLNTPQSGSEQSEKSKGNDPEEAGKNTAAEEHGAGRAQSGFTVEEMVSEFRAMRATVIRLWTEAQGKLGVDDLEDLTRFNEAIDQSLAESVTKFTEHLDSSKEAFLAVLAHDLRTPLSAVTKSARSMLDDRALSEPNAELATQIASSTARMNNLVGDLLDFTRSQFGGGIPIERTELSMDKVVNDVIDLISVIHPGRTIKVDAQGDMTGQWDCHRVSQALTSLISNALEHGSDWTIVRVTIVGDGNDVRVAIQNSGTAIPSEKLQNLFRLTTPKDGGSPSLPITEVRLGLYIAERIISAHGGSLGVQSSEARGTTFTIHLPRRPSQ